MEAKTRVRWQKLVDQFGLEYLDGFRPWDATRVDELGTGPSHGELHAARFLLAVWDPGNQWKIGRFDLIDAIGVWDEKRTNAFLSWVNDPWWP